MASSSASQEDALTLFSTALNASSSKETESTSLKKLITLFQTQPSNLSILLPTLVQILPRSKPSIKSWIVDVLDLTFCRWTVSVEGRNILSVHAPEAILYLLNEPKLTHAKTAIQVFASIYQSIFRHTCTNPGTSQKIWNTTLQIKERIHHLFEHNTDLSIRIPSIKAFQKIAQTGIKTSHTAMDPRSSSTKTNTMAGTANTASDISISHVTQNHPFLQASALEQEANEILRRVVTLIFTSNVPDLVMACINTLAFLAKKRPSMSNIILQALVSWTPAALGSRTHTQVRNVEKTLRLVLWHFHRNGSLAQPQGSSSSSSSSSTQITDALETQKQRMEAAARADWQRKESEAKRKRESINEQVSETHNAKRSRQEPQQMDIYNTQPQQQQPPQPSTAATTQLSKEQLLHGARAFCRAAADPSRPNPLAQFDVTSLPVGLVIDLILANLQALTEDEMQRAISNVRGRLQHELATNQQQPPPPPKMETADDDDDPDMDMEIGTPPPRNPLKEDVDEDDEEGQGQANQVAPIAPEEEEDEENALAGLEDFELAPPEPFSQTEARALIKESVSRICEMGGQAASFSAQMGDDVPAETLWASLVTRLATRGFDEDLDEDESETTSQSVSPQKGTLSSQADAIRQTMLDFLVSDFPTRTPFAIQWISEEWYADQRRRAQKQRCQYEVWLSKIVTSVLPTLDVKDKTLFHFLSSLPSLPSHIVSQISSLCSDEVRNTLGFIGLREIANSRPPCRPQAVKILLDLAKDANKVIRAPAIITVRGWIGHGGELERRVLDAADECLNRLTVKDGAGDKEAQDGEAKQDGEDKEGGEQKGSGDAKDGVDGSPSKDRGDGTTATEGVDGTTATDGVDGETAGEDAPARDPVQDSTFQLTEEDQVLQFVELPFALSIKIPDILDRVFAAYISMPETVQKALQKHIAALVRSLGPNNSKLLSLLKTFPPGSDTLALSVYNIMAEKGRTQSLITAVKTLVSERSEVDPHFLVPIMPNLSKAEIVKLLPRAVTIINSKTAEDRNTLKALFTSIVSKPGQGFGSVSTNLPRVREADNLTPVELMVLLHTKEKEIGLKTTVEAIRICFSMTEIFRSEILAAVLNQLIEESTLPILFMRTTIMSVSTYKSLSGYVSSNLLSRLIVKKIWQNKLLWDGFILCLEQLLPNSFNALLQLPQEQLLQVLKKKPKLKDGLRQYLERKVGAGPGGGGGGGNTARLNSYLELLDAAEAPGGENGVGANANGEGQ
ncbi:unnamed protein product [Sympodiomycopsis kandeliae]